MELDQEEEIEGATHNQHTVINKLDFPVTHQGMPQTQSPAAGKCAKRVLLRLDLFYRDERAGLPGQMAVVHCG